MRAPVIFLFIMLTTVAVKADTFVVNDMNDAVDANPGDLVCETADGTCTLRAAIQEANALAGTDEIEIPAGVFFLTLVGAGEDMAATGDLDVTQAIEIRGAGVDQTVIDGLGADRIFDSIMGVSLSLEDLTLTSGTVGADNGGAIRHPGPGDLSLENVYAHHNQAVQAGAVLHIDGLLTVVNCRFEENTALGAGGAIFYDGGPDIVIEGSLFKSNFAFGGPGGACHFDNTNGLVVTSTHFEDNWSGGVAGGLYFTGTDDVELTDSTFLKNIAISAGGGAFITTTAGGLSVTTTRFEDNTSANAAGGLYFGGVDDVELRDSTFLRNEGFSGGGGAFIVTSNGGLSASGTQFEDNTSASAGGGLNFTGANDVEISESTFLRNSGVSVGGGANISAGGGLTLTNSQIEDNVAQGTGGGLQYTGATDVIINETSFRRNKGVSGGGGALLSIGTDLRVTASQFEDNSVSGGSGGGLYCSVGGEVNVSDALIANNSAFNGAGGGALWNIGSGLTMTRSLVAGNDSTGAGAQGGGFVHSAGIAAEIENTTFSGNRSSGQGGAVYTNANMNFTNVTFAENIATVSGGGIFNSGATINLANTLLFAGAVGDNCTGGVTSLGGNISNDSSCVLAGIADQDNVNPQIGPLADNGGPTMTHALLSGSPAIDGGRSGACPDDDQRGIARPFDGDGDGVEACDIGAFESSTDCDDNGVDDGADVGAGDGTDCDDNGVLDACEHDDTDEDGIVDICDECTDTDGDGFGDPGFTANTCEEDNCPDVANADQADSDGNGIGDACQDCCGGATPMAMPFMLAGWSFVRIRRRTRSLRR